MERINLKGKVFGKLKVLHFVKNNVYGTAQWMCQCSCGKKKIIQSSSLLNNNTNSCGCLAIELTRQRSLKHGFRGTKFYNCWRSIKKRCNNKNRKDYKYWGGRGITYDSKWEDFLGFKEDMYFKYIYAKKKYKDSIYPLSIERENVNGNYNFKNCIFIPMNQQQRNQRKQI